MSNNGMAAKCLAFALGTAIVLSGCQSEQIPSKEVKAAGQAGQEQIDPVLTSQTGDLAKDNAASNGQGEVERLKAKHTLASTTENKVGKAVVTNAESELVVVNKKRFLPDGYTPSDLVEPKVPFSFKGPHEKRQLRQVAATALEELFAKAKEDGMKLNAVSGYRSYKRQQSLYNHYVNTKGEQYASRVSAVPGSSEHQTGLAMDVSSPSANNELEQHFGDTVEGKWLAEHAHEFGFIIRYPQQGESITGYIYEPWHIRYVGKTAAAAIYEQQTTLEQFLQ
ncbi:M15 family metallopeptidase [Paenibacillus sp. 481]|uniref:M15 family metallopeptidase n=1 Tax=Paenibacillus sp. 481 TaxID=2835869 RepID=UPI001E6264E0|nr:M15 family metallopeptidase [Paenibacillus sp. 481]UHA75019.1 M15 family metallopeptidase [Paenibacillus sp. 481]